MKEKKKAGLARRRTGKPSRRGAKKHPKQESASMPPPHAAICHPAVRRKMSEALRESGLDEQGFAAKFAGMVERLEKARSEKLLLEVLKELGKLLEAYPAQRRAEPSGPVTLQLIHCVARPLRAQPAIPAALPSAESAEQAAQLPAETEIAVSSAAS